MKKLLIIAMMLLPAVAWAQSISGVISGRVLLANGQPAAGVRVSAVVAAQSNQSAGFTTMASLAQTDAEGRYVLESVPPGRYLVTAGPVDIATYYPGTLSADKATAVSVAGTGTVTGIDFSMAVATNVTVSGRVITSSNQVVTSGTVGLLPVSGPTPAGGARGGSPVPTSRVNPDGTFRFESVRAGVYRIELAPTGAFTAQPLVVTVVDSDLSGLELIGITMVNVTGSMAVEGGGLRPRFNVSFVPYQGGRNPVTASITTATATFTARLMEGEYRVSWTVLPAGYVVKAITAGSTDLLREPLKVLSSGGQQNVIVTLGVAFPAPWVRVSGRIRDAGNGPLPGLLTLEPASSLPTALAATTTLTSASLIDRLETTLRSDGSFEFPMAPAGSYTIRANTAAWPLASIVVANKDLTGIDVVIPRMKDVTGSVLIAGLSQTTPRLSFSLADALGTFPVAVTIQPDGTFKASFPEGERRVTLNVPGFTVKSLSYGSTDLLKNPLKVALFDADELQVTLTAAGTVATGGVLGGVLGGVSGGTVVGGTLGGTLGGTVGGTLGGVVGGGPGGGRGAPPPPPPPPPPPSVTGPIRVGGDVQASNCLSCPAPEYPALARTARVSDTVVLSIVVGTDGSVRDVAVIRGHALLQQAAVDAVRQWRYRPQMLNGVPVETSASVSVSFVFK